MDDDRGAPFLARLDHAVARLADHAERAHDGLTRADEATGEQWDAGQVWAHLAEFGAYWIAQLDHVVAAGSADPVPFGRTKKDPDRIAAIEAGRHESVDAAMAAVQDSAAELRARLTTYDSADWSRIGRHETLGDMTVERILDEFLVGHYEQHADQLDELQ